MKTDSLTPYFVVVALALATITTPAAGASLDEAKALFAAASFDDALAALDHLDSPETQPEALQYRALCLMALGRTVEAQKITEVLVESAPTFVPTETDLPPRFMTLLTETRRKTLPLVARQLFAEGRDQYHAKQHAEAQRNFQQVMTLVNDPVWKDASEAADLRTLASGFLDLVSAAMTPPPAAVAAPPAAAAPPRAATPPPVVAQPAPVAPARSAVVAPRARTATEKAGLQPPVAIRQPMPRWDAPDRVSAERTFYGSIKVRIGSDGQVVNAVIQKPTHPLYDQLLLEAARSWVYKPAVRDGQPISVEKVVTYELKAR